MMDSAVEKTVKLPTFDGERKNFHVWWMRFKAYATVYKFSAALKEGGEADLPKTEDDVLDETKSDEKRKADARKRNGVAMANFAMAFTTESQMGMIYKAVTTEYPGGLAHLVVQALFKKYEPDDKITRVEMREQLTKVSMKAHQDPTTLFEQISAIQNRYNNASRKIDEEDLIAVILKAAPKDYQAVLTVEQRVKGDNLVLADLESAMHQHWRQTKANKDEDKVEMKFHYQPSVEHAFIARRKGIKAINVLRKKRLQGRNLKENATTVEKKGTKLQIVGRKKKTEIKDPKDIKYQLKGLM
jgi:hypothetical protein